MNIWYRLLVVIFFILLSPLQALAASCWSLPTGGIIQTNSNSTPPIAGARLVNCQNSSGGQIGCPQGTQWNGQACQPLCTGGAFFNGSGCACTQGNQWNGRQCVAIQCQPGARFNGQTCVAICRPGTQWDGQGCQSVCSGGAIYNGNGCSCPQGTHWNGQQCQAVQCQLGTRFNGQTCVAVCQQGSQWDGQTCRSVCQSGTVFNGNSCVSVCQPGTQWNGQACQSLCRGGAVFSGNGCSCPQGTQWNNQSQVCQQACLGGMVQTVNGCGCPQGTQQQGQQCIANPPSCPGGTVWNGQSCLSTGLSSNTSAGTSNGMCWMFPNGGYSPATANSTPPVYGARLDRCPVSNSTTNSQTTCLSGQVLSGNTCACPQGNTWNGQTCVKNDASGIVVNNSNPNSTSPPLKGIGAIQTTQHYRSVGEVVSGQYHTGRDYGAPKETGVLAVRAGRVIQRSLNSTGQKNNCLGNVLILAGNDGYYYLYAHLTGYSVNDGANVKAGDLIGLTGNTVGYKNSGDACAAVGYHLHFEKRNSLTNGLYDPLLGRDAWGYSATDPNNIGYYDPPM